MFPASLARWSTAPLRVMFSLPAKSTRYSLPTRITSSPSASTSLTDTVTMNTECDRLLCLFSSVSAVRLFAFPVSSRSNMSAAVLTCGSSSPCITTPALGSSMIRTFCLGLSASPAASRSVISSLYSSRNEHLTVNSFTPPRAFKYRKMCPTALGITPASFWFSMFPVIVCVFPVPV